MTGVDGIFAISVSENVGLVIDDACLTSARSVIQSDQITRHRLLPSNLPLNLWTNSRRLALTASLKASLREGWVIVRCRHCARIFVQRTKSEMGCSNSS